MRVKIFRIIIIILFLIILIDLFYVQVIKGKYFFHLSVNNRIRVVPLEGLRGEIMDRNGNVLAKNRKAYDVMVVPQEIKDKEKLFQYLSDTLRVEKSYLEKKYAQKKYTPFAPVAVAEDVTREEAIKLEENRYRFSSLLVVESFNRVYPSAEVGSHVIGYVGKMSRSSIDQFKEYGYSPASIVGKTGVEEYYDSYLKGSVGGLQVEVDSRGRQVRLLSLKEPDDGQNITLTIDNLVQDISYEVIEQKRGSIIVMDMNNGEVLGMVSSPSFDPNALVSLRDKSKAAVLFRNPHSPLLNRSISGAFPPGSVFKIPVAISALANKKINANTTFECVGHHELGGTRFGCAHIHGAQNLIEAIAHSCNIYFYRLGLILGESRIQQHAKLLGLGRLTHIDLPYEKEGLVPSRKQRFLKKKQRWFAGDTLNLSIGQGDVLSTPLQLVRMMATVARDGKEVQPHVIKAIGGRDVKKYQFERKVPINTNVFDDVKTGLRSTVASYSGTANVLSFDDMIVAGKTGTAQSAPGKEHHAWFVGYTKGTKKEVAFSIFLEYGGSSQNATLVARQLLVRLRQEGII